MLLNTHKFNKIHVPKEYATVDKQKFNQTHVSKCYATEDTHKFNHTDISKLFFIYLGIRYVFLSHFITPLISTILNYCQL